MFIASPIWAVVASDSIPAGSRGRAYGYYFIGLAFGVIPAIGLIWEALRSRKHPERRKLMNKDWYWFLVLGVGGAGGPLLTSFVEGTFWAPFLIGIFGAVGLAFIAISFIYSSADQR